MYCLKCGQETPEQQLFCPDCLQSMEAYPVRPDTPIQLPKRPETAGAKKARQKELSPEVQLPKLKVRNRRLAALVFFLLVALCLSVGALVLNFFQDLREPDPKGGSAQVLIQKDCFT